MRGTFPAMDGQPGRPWLRSRKAVWLAAGAMLTCGIVGLLVVLFDNAASLGLSTSNQCTVAYAGSDARVTFDGAGAATMCSDWQQADPNWHRSTAPVVGAPTECTGTHGGLSWKVADQDEDIHGSDACTALAALAQGGTLDIP